MKERSFKGNAVFAACIAAYTAIYIGRVNLSVASPLMIEEGLADLSQIGVLSGIFSIVYAAGRLLSGRVCDKRAPGVIIALGAVSAGLSNVFTGFAPPYLVMALLWGINALGQSFLWGSVLNALSRNFDGALLKRKTAYMTLSIPAGNIAGYLISSYLCESRGWNAAFCIPGILCILCGLQALFVLRGTAGGSGERKENGTFFAAVREIPVKDIPGKLLPAFLHGLIKDNSSFFLPTILAIDYLVSGKITGLMIVIVPAIGFAGRFIYPSVLRLFNDKEDKVSVLCFIIIALSALVLWLCPVPAVMAAVLIGIIYAAASMINTTFLSIYPIRFNDRGCAATVSGVMDFITYLGASAGSLVFGLIAESFGFRPLYLCWFIISALAVLLLIFTERQANRHKQ